MSIRSDINTSHMDTLDIRPSWQTIPTPAIAGRKRCLLATSLAVMLCAMVAKPAAGAIEDREFATDQQRELYFDVIRELRCLVCQNQNLAESDADLAKDLRDKTYTLINEGNDRQSIVDYMVQRYGDFVLYRPPFKLSTAFLWLGPLALLIAGAGIFLRVSRRPAHEDQVTDNVVEGGVDIETARRLLSELNPGDDHAGTKTSQQHKADL